VKKWAAFESAVNEFAPRYSQYIMCMYDLDRFSGEMVMNVLQTHPRVFVNGIVIQNPHYIPMPQFLEALGELPLGQPAGGGGDVAGVDAGPGEQFPAGP
jgi:hypothetical protein